MTTKLKDHFPLDQLASQLAADAGHSWTKMAEFPGYNRRVWRDEARIHVREHHADARIECLPAGWDGREGMCFIRRSS